MTVREFGRVVLMGGVGMAGGEDLGLPYPWLMRNGITVLGRWMYPPDAVDGLVRLVRSGLLDLHAFAVTEFDLVDVNDAVAHAAAHGGPFRSTVLRP
jgi:alcohol dehydrogenase